MDTLECGKTRLHMGLGAHDLAAEPQPEPNPIATADGWARMMIVLRPEPYREALAVS